MPASSILSANLFGKKNVQCETTLTTAAPKVTPQPALAEGESRVELHSLIHAMSFNGPVNENELESTVKDLLQILNSYEADGGDLANLKIFGVKDKSGQIRLEVAPRLSSEAATSGHTGLRMTELSMVAEAPSAMIA